MGVHRAPPHGSSKSTLAVGIVGQLGVVLGHFFQRAMHIVCIVVGLSNMLCSTLGCCQAGCGVVLGTDPGGWGVNTRQKQKQHSRAWMGVVQHSWGSQGHCAAVRAL